MAGSGSGADAAGRAGIGGLEALLTAQAEAGEAPVERWNPPDCGDIGLAIKADGTWAYRGSPIGRKPLVKLFARVLRRDTDGHHYLVTPVEKIAIEVEDAPFQAVEMHVEGSGEAQQLIFRTNVDDIVRCGPDRPLRFAVEEGSGGLKPYVLVRGRLEARLTRALCYDLVELAVGMAGAGNAQRLGVWSGGVCWEVGAE